MKFVNLLMKELKELINAQMILSLVIILSMFGIMGNVMNGAIDDASEEMTHPKINISDCDDTELTRNILEMLESSSADVKVFDIDGENYAEILNSNGLKNMVIIPKGFTDSVNSGEKAQLVTISKLKSASAMANVSTGSDGATELIKKVVTNIVAEGAGISNEQLELIENPIETSENTVVGDKSASIPLNNVLGKITMQNTVLPIIVFMLIVMTSQSLVNSISSEKIDKTLETLLSTPVTRTAIITAKMLAAAIVALINAGAMTFGVSNLMKTSTNQLAEGVSEAVGQYLSADEAINALGLNLSAVDYLLVGLQLFLTIMICLSVSIMLGALVNDTKSSQTVIMPLMILAMVPYIISILADINALPTAIRIVVYAIPFTHTFSAMQNLMFGNTSLFWIGAVYQLAVFFICMFFALRLFSSDKILTVSLNFGQKSKFRKKHNDDE